MKRQNSKWVPIGVTALWVQVLVGCVAIQPLSGDDICDEVGFAVAAKTLDCTDNDALANRRYEQFQKQLTCTVVNPERAPVDKYLECAVAVNSMGCETHLGFGEDIIRMVSASSPQCSRIFKEIETAVKPADWQPPHNGLGLNPMDDVILTGLALCPSPTQGDEVEVIVNNPRVEPVVVIPVALPCKELDVVLTVPAQGTATYTASTGAAFLVRSIEGSLILNAGVSAGLVLEVPQ